MAETADVDKFFADLAAGVATADARHDAGAASATRMPPEPEMPAHLVGAASQRGNNMADQQDEWMREHPDHPMHHATSIPADAGVHATSITADAGVARAMAQLTMLQQQQGPRPDYSWLRVGFQADTEPWQPKNEPLYPRAEPSAAGHPTVEPVRAVYPAQSSSSGADRRPVHVQNRHAPYPVPTPPPPPARPQMYDDEDMAAAEHGVPWQLRGPARPTDEEPTWKGQRWRILSARWGNRGGEKRAWWSVFYKNIVRHGKHRAAEIADEECGPRM